MLQEVDGDLGGIEMEEGGRKGLGGANGVMSVGEGKEINCQGLMWIRVDCRDTARLEARSESS